MSSTHPAADVRPNTEPIKPKRLSWEDTALWLFLVVLFIASGVAAYLFWLKCS
jgi:hypothetical protein